MLRVTASLFFTGLVLGYGPCLLSCGPLLVSYITATKKSGISGLKVYLIFSATRLFVYLVFGILVGLFGERLLHRLFESSALALLFLLFGGFLAVLGALIMSGKSDIENKCSSFIHRYVEPEGIKNVIIFGLVVSLSPCLPLMGVLGFIALLSDTWAKGAMYMSAFAFGTIVSPLIILSVTAGWAARHLSRHSNIMRIVRLICGFMICLLGINLIWSGLR
ncbi:MAG TPA: hypothetical protein DCL35_03795 [Candidatus Omnitrophica bacterium]|nr:hypothetical protein [Candidatus Omnitrophota bacterium]